MKKCILLSVFFAFIFIQSSFAQRTITGMVSSADDGMGLPGVRVLVRGTTIGTITDLNGAYSITVPDSTAILVFEFMGMETREAKIGKNYQVHVELKSSDLALDEIVVVGYGVQRKRDVTGSVSHVDSKKLRKNYDSNINSSLQGKMAGVSVNSGSSSNNQLRIRGTSSLSGSKNPLIIVDGKPFSGDISEIPANNIKSVEVNKDAANSTIYGTQGSNVVVITTNNGTESVSPGGFKKIEKQKPLTDDGSGNESYNTIVENEFKSVKNEPLSTFSIDVDKASYSNVRRYINNGSKPPKDAVRIEEMINYFNYDYPEPTGDHPIEVYTEIAACPWQSKHKLLHIGLQGKRIDTEKLPLSNIVFLIDVSGSMQDQNKLPLLKDAFKLLVNNLRDNDKVSIVVYAGAAGQVLAPTYGNNKEVIISALGKLQAGGSTAGGAGIQLAYKIAKDNFIENGNNRVILATDGDFNVGASSDNEMERLIEEKRQDGIFLTCLGFGIGNYKDSKMETLADKGNGNFAYIDNLDEAKKTLVSEFGSTLFTIAKDVKLQIEFNPAKVKAYRLIGYENRLLNDEDFNNDTKDAGEMGAGHSVTALYEIVPADSKNLEQINAVDDLKYQSIDQNKIAETSGEIANLKIRYKEPKKMTSVKFVHPIPDGEKPIEKCSDTYRFSASVALFGMILRESVFVKNADYNTVIELASNTNGFDKGSYRKEFIDLVQRLK